MTKAKFIEIYANKAILFQKYSARVTFLQQIRDNAISPRNVDDDSFKKDFNIDTKYMIFSPEIGLRKGLISDINNGENKVIAIKGVIFYDETHTIVKEAEKFTPKRRFKGEIVTINGGKAIILNVSPEMVIETVWLESTNMFRFCTPNSFLEISEDNFKRQ